MDAEEGEPRVRHRIDQSAHQAVALRHELVVLAAKRHDARRRPAAFESDEPVRLQPGAADE
jgi:hypothetical protein